MRTFLKMAAVGFLAVAASSAQAAVVGIFDDNFGSDAIEVRVTVEDSGLNQVDITLEIISDNTGNIGDIRGFFFDLADFAGAGNYDGVGADLTGGNFNTSDLGGGNNVNPRGPFDIGVMFGSPGIGSDDIQSTTFSLGTAVGTLSEASFFGDNDAAIRVTSVGPVGGGRDGSSKVGVGGEVPLPASGFLILAGIGGLALLRKRRS